MNCLPVEESLQALFLSIIPLSQAQTRRIALLCVAVLLAGEVHLTKVARFLKSEAHQDSRVRWIARLLQVAFMTQERVYQPMLQAALASFGDRCWHLVIDRTTLWDGRIDLVTISLNYRKRALPLVWCQVPFGGGPKEVYVDLLRRCLPLVPANIQVVFHGDTEFGSAAMIRVLREIGWDFMFAQKSDTCFRRPGAAHTEPLSSLPVTPHRRCELAKVDLFASKPIGAINILAFYQPHYTQCRKRTRTVCYLATSLPLTPGTRRLGRRRWGTEPFYRDYKSSGWHVTLSRLKHPARQEGLLIVLALVYLWAVCMGRWLCKIGQRSQVDAKPRRHLSQFRIGWDWLIHQLICRSPCPTLLRLYA